MHVLIKEVYTDDQILVGYTIHGTGEGTKLLKTAQAFLNAKYKGHEIKEANTGRKLRVWCDIPNADTTIVFVIQEINEVKGPI